MHTTKRYSRRQFIGSALATTATGALLPALAAENKLVFSVAGKEWDAMPGGKRSR